MHRAERFCWVRIDGVRSTVTFFHLAGLNLSKQHEISYVEVDDRDNGVELHNYRKRGPKNIGLQTDNRLIQKNAMTSATLKFPGLLSNFHWFSFFPRPCFPVFPCFPRF